MKLKMYVAIQSINNIKIIMILNNKIIYVLRKCCLATASNYVKKKIFSEKLQLRNNDCIECRNLNLHLVC